MAMNRNRKKDYEWRKANQTRLNFTLNVNNEKDVIEYLNKVENKHAYIVNLIRKDIENNECKQFDKPTN